MSLPYNELKGPLPPELGNLSQLVSLSLSVNQVQGAIPAELGNLTQLVFLDLGGNQLTGTLPVELGNLTKLKYLALGNNQIGGAIPPALGKIENLESLYLLHNQLSGPIPPELGDLANLTQLYLSHNELSGSIPTTFNALNNLFEPDLSYNQLSGAVPEYLTQIDQQMLWGNLLDGTITINNLKKFSVDFMGVHFSADPSLAISIWPELNTATPLREVQDGPSYWLALPEHIRFTFADPELPLTRKRMGFDLAAEGQILVFPLAAFFPLTTETLPDTIEVEDREAFHANYDIYLSETTAVLDQISPDEFMPNLFLLDAIVASLRIEPDLELFGE